MVGTTVDVGNCCATNGARWLLSHYLASKGSAKVSGRCCATMHTAKPFGSLGTNSHGNGKTASRLSRRAEVLATTATLTCMLLLTSAARQVFKSV